MASVKVKYLDSSPAFIQFTIIFFLLSLMDRSKVCGAVLESITLIHNVFPTFKWTGSGFNGPQMLDAADLFIPL